jgi:hypothetical protein
VSAGSSAIVRADETMINRHRGCCSAVWSSRCDAVIRFDWLSSFALRDARMVQGTYAGGTQSPLHRLHGPVGISGMISAGSRVMSKEKPYRTTS